MASTDNNDTTIRFPLCLYYSPDPDQLRSDVEWAFNYDFPSNLPTPPQNSSWRWLCSDDRNADDDDDIPFLLLPHGACCDSGPLVAEALVELDRRTGFFCQKEDGGDSRHPKRTLVIIGTEHACTAKHFICLAPFHRWRTPLGDVDVDVELQELLEAIPVEREPFLNEHSIENQLPYIQYLLQQKRALATTTILPLSVRSVVSSAEYEMIRDGKCNALLALAELLRSCSDKNNNDSSNRMKRKIAVIATTDYSHVGPAYNFVPPGWTPFKKRGPSIPEYIRHLDASILDSILSTTMAAVDNNHRVLVESFYDATHNAAMCGRGAVLLWLQLWCMLSSKNRSGSSRRRSVHLIRHIVGSDIGPKHDDQTGFATLVIL